MTKLELEKLQWLIKNQLVAPESTADGLGGIRAVRMDKAVTMLSKAFDLPGKPTSADIFTNAYLPDAAVRKLPWAKNLKSLRWAMTMKQKLR